MNLAAPAASMAEKSDAPPLDRAFVAALLASLPDHVCLKDRDSRYIAVSRAHALHHHRAEAEFTGKTDFDLFGAAHARPAFEDEQNIIRTGEPIIGRLEKETWPDGRITWVHTSKMPLRDGQGGIIGTFGISQDVTSSREMELALEKSQRELVDASRLAGRAEIATGVLHNVGHVLNSLNVSATILCTGLRDLKADSLAKVGEMLHDHSANLGIYLTRDPKGRLVPVFIESLARHFSEDRARLLQEIDSLQKNVEHVKEIVAMQQSYATMVGIVEPLDAAAHLEDALRMNSSALVRHDIRVVRDFAAVPPILAERGKVLQILVNLISNAKYAASDSSQAEKEITLRLAPGAPGRVHLIVHDNGIGILAAHLTRIFQHGFTTKATGHGFGLHSSANAAKEMKGTLTAHSDGPGLGATFILDLPAAPVRAAPIP